LEALEMNFDRPFEVMAFYWWLVAHGDITNPHEAGLYFENPEEWAKRHGWLLDLYEARRAVAL
jgi:hypothetical protein